MVCTNVKTPPRHRLSTSFPLLSFSDGVSLGALNFSGASRHWRFAILQPSHVKTWCSHFFPFPIDSLQSSTRLIDSDFCIDERQIWHLLEVVLILKSTYLLNEYDTRTMSVKAYAPYLGRCPCRLGFHNLWERLSSRYQPGARATPKFLSLLA